MAKETLNKAEQDEYVKKVADMESKSLMKKYCPQDVMDKVKYRQSKLRGTFKDCVMSGECISYTPFNIDSLHMLPLHTI